VTQGP